MKSRWEKKVKSKHKTINRKKKIEQSYGNHSTYREIHPSWSDTGCVCSCTKCSAKNSWNHKSERKRMRNREQKEIERYYKEIF